MSESIECGADLMNETSETLRRYVVLPSTEAGVAVALWIVATHGVQAFEHATRLAVHSPVKRCGKSRLLEVIAGLVHEPLQTTNISVPALFRMIDAAGDRPPTLILDEADRLLGSRKLDEDNASLVAMLNNGFRRGSPTWRCVGPTQVPTPFQNFAFVAVAGIGTLPDTVEDRAVSLTMRRRLPGEPVEKFRLRTDLPALHALRERIAAWVAANITEIEQAAHVEGSVPRELEDRAQDAWEPLCGIAAVAGGGWPDLARAAAIRLTREAEANDAENLDARLLADVKAVFDARSDARFVPTAHILSELAKSDDMPWSAPDYTSSRLAGRLRKFGAKPRRDTTGKERGYYLSDLTDAFSRYLPSEPSRSSE